MTRTRRRWRAGALIVAGLATLAAVACAILADLAIQAGAAVRGSWWLSGALAGYGVLCWTLPRWQREERKDDPTE